VVSFFCRLLINCSTRWTFSFIFHQRSTLATPVFIRHSSINLLHKEVEEISQKQVAYVKRCSNYKEEIAENTASCQSHQIQESRGRRKLTEQFFERSQKYNDKGPYTQHKYRKYKGYLKWAQRRIKVKMLPRFRSKHLHTLINGSRESQTRRKQASNGYTLLISVKINQQELPFSL